MPGEVQFDLNPVNGLTHKQLVKVGIMSFALTKLDTVTGETVDELFDTFTVQTNMIDPSRAWRPGCRVIDFGQIAWCLQVRVLVLGMSSLADVNDILLTDVEPMHRKTKFRVRSFSKTQVVTKPVARPLGIVRQDKNMLQKTQAHQRSPLTYRACSAETGRVSPVSTNVRVAATDA